MVEENVNFPPIPQMQQETEAKDKRIQELLNETAELKKKITGMNKRMLVLEKENHS